LSHDKYVSFGHASADSTSPQPLHARDF
jgi:hypothetical protein